MSLRLIYRSHEPVVPISMAHNPAPVRSGRVVARWPAGDTSESYFTSGGRFFSNNGLTYPAGKTRSGSGRMLRYVTSLATWLQP